MTSNSASLLALMAALSCTGCGDGHLRGDVAPSPDGRTYFAVIDENGASCGPITFDGEVWPHRVGVFAEIEPGTHTLEDCGIEIEFDVPPGVRYGFDYWGP